MQNKGRCKPLFSYPPNPRTRYGLGGNEGYLGENTSSRGWARRLRDSYVYYYTCRSIWVVLPFADQTFRFRFTQGRVLGAVATAFGWRRREGNMRCRNSERFTPQWPKRLTRSLVPFNAGSQDVNGPKGPSKTVMAITTCFVRSLKNCVGRRCQKHSAL